MGVVEPIEFKNFEDLDERFQADWIAFGSKNVNQRFVFAMKQRCTKMAAV
ncbi:MAG: hypothetical protein ACYCY7_08985 [Gallionella sp.]